MDEHTHQCRSFVKLDVHEWAHTHKVSPTEMHPMWERCPTCEHETDQRVHQLHECFGYNPSEDDS